MITESLANDAANETANDTSANETSPPADWSYNECPDVDECALGLDNCHENATCGNLYHQIPECRCNRGFIGDGITCTRT